MEGNAGNWALYPVTTINRLVSNFGVNKVIAQREGCWVGGEVQGWVRACLQAWVQRTLSCGVVQGVDFAIGNDIPGTSTPSHLKSLSLHPVQPLSIHPLISFHLFLSVENPHQSF